MQWLAESLAIMTQVERAEALAKLAFMLLFFVVVGYIA